MNRTKSINKILEMFLYVVNSQKEET